MGGTPGHFLRAFHDKGRVAPYLRQIPVFLLKSEDMGERGAILKACRLYRESVALTVAPSGIVKGATMHTEDAISKALEEMDESDHPMPAAKTSKEVLLLSADVGGTSSRLRLFTVPAENIDDASELQLVQTESIVHEFKYTNAHFDTFDEVLQSFLDGSGQTSLPVLACLAVAGVVVQNRVKFVNLGWTIDGDALAAAFGIAKIVLINDFEAQGYGVLTLDIDVDCTKLHDVPPVRGAPKALLGAGTGLGEAFLTAGKTGEYQVWPAEGGHAEFAPRQLGSSRKQFDLLKYLQIKFSAKARISVERVVSGKGISNIYEFLAWKDPKKINRAVFDRWRGLPDAKIHMNPAIVAEAANSGECELCTEAVELFVSAYGAEAGVLALKYMPLGGLYLTGGVTSKLHNFVLGEHGPFMSSFLDKGRVSQMLRRVPIYIVKQEDMGERGAMLKVIRLHRESCARPATNGQAL